jgi:hypothetical protein
MASGVAAKHLAGVRLKSAGRREIAPLPPKKLSLEPTTD